MSDNEDLLADDLGDQSLADYNLGNEEEEQLLADDYESGSSQNVPTSMGASYGSSEMVPTEFSGHGVEYGVQIPYQPIPEPECVVPNITVEVPNAPIPEHNVFPYEQPPVYGPEHAVVPPPIPAAVPMESSQIVPSEMPPPPMAGEPGFPCARPAPRLPRQRDLPDTLDKVIVRGQRGRGNWRPQRFSHPYHRNNVLRNNFQQQRASFPPPQIRPSPPQLPVPRPEVRPERPEIQPDPVPIAPPPIPVPHSVRQELSPERPMLQEVPFRPENPQFGPNFQRFQFRPEERNFRPNFNPMQRFPGPPRQFAPRSFGPPVREIAPNNASHMPQVTIHQPLVGREPEVRMLPLQLPPNLPPGGLAGKKVLINPHFKGNFQPPVDGVSLPAYIPTRIHKSPPLSPTLENKFGPIKDIDDAAERFIAEQRNALARAAGRKFRRSPQRYIENTTIEIENELALAPMPARRNSDDELLRRQEEFINANRAGLRRRMRTPSPPEAPREVREPPREPRSPRSPRERRRSLSPRRSPDRRRPSPPRDEESEYRRRMREQESLRERVLRAKELRRRKNAVAASQSGLNKTNDTRTNDARNNDRERDRERVDKEKEPPKEAKPEEKPAVDMKPDSTERERVRDRSPVRSPEVNSTSEPLTPPRATPPEPAMTPPLPAHKPADKSMDKSTDKSAYKSADKWADKSMDKSIDKLLDSDDDLDLILGDIDGILSDEDDSGRFKEKAKKPEPEAVKPAKPADLRSKLPPRGDSADKLPKQRIIFNENTKKEPSPPRRAAPPPAPANKPPQPEKKEKEEERKPQSFPNRRVILQTKFTQAKEKSVFARIEAKADPGKPNPGSIFSRAVRTAIGSEKTRIVVKKDEPTVEYGSDSDDEGIAIVSNLPEGMTDTRLKTLAGGDVQSVVLDSAARSARVTFRSLAAAALFRRRFHDKHVARARLHVSLQ